MNNTRTRRTPFEEFKYFEPARHSNVKSSRSAAYRKHNADERWPEISTHDEEDFSLRARPRNGFTADVTAVEGVRNGFVPTASTVLGESLGAVCGLGAGKFQIIPLLAKAFHDISRYPIRDSFCPSR